MYSLKQITKNYVNGKQITEVLKGIDLDIAEGDFLAIMGSSGAGKTTLLNHILKNQEGYKVAIIVNDIGEINVDQKLIDKNAQMSCGLFAKWRTMGCMCLLGNRQNHSAQHGAGNPANEW